MGILNWLTCVNCCMSLIGSEFDMVYVLIVSLLEENSKLKNYTIREYEWVRPSCSLSILTIYPEHCNWHRSPSSKGTLTTIFFKKQNLCVQQVYYSPSLPPKVSRSWVPLFGGRGEEEESCPGSLYPGGSYYRPKRGAGGSLPLPSKNRNFYHLLTSVLCVSG